MKTTILATGLLTLLGGSPALAQEFEFTLHHFLGPEAPAHTDMLEPWARQVEENSGGRVAIEIYPSMTLGGRPTELVQQARDGVVDLVWTLNGYTPGLFPRTEVFELPNVYENDIAATNLAMASMFDEYLADDYRGLEVMFLHVHAGQGLQTTEIEAHAPEDLQGAALRIPTRTGSWAIEELGAQPVAMPVPELPQALSKGVVDGALIPWEIIPALRIYEQTDFQIEGPEKERIGTSVFQVSMNKGRWDALPDDIQQAFRDAGGEDWLRELGEILAGGRRAGDRDRRGERQHPSAADRRGMGSLRGGARARGRSLGRAGLRRGRRRRRPGGRGPLRNRRRHGSMSAEFDQDRTPIERGVLGRIVVWWAIAGGGLLALVVLVNVWSVIGPAIGLPFAGDFELTEMGVAVAVFTFLPYCQLTGQNVTADIFTANAGRRTVAALSAIGSLVALLFAALLLWRMWFGLLDQKSYDYATTILQVPIWWAYVPILFSLAMLLLAAVETLRHEIREAR